MLGWRHHHALASDVRDQRRGFSQAADGRGGNIERRYRSKIKNRSPGMYTFYLCARFAVKPANALLTHVS